MELILKKTPKNATIIEGFPGFGLVGTITTEFLLNNLETEEIEKILNPHEYPVEEEKNISVNMTPMNKEA